MWPGLAVVELGPVLDLVGQVDELAGVLELRGVDQVHAHQVGHVAGRDALGDLADHLGVRDVGQVDRLVRVGRVPVADELVDHPACCRPTAPTSVIAFGSSDRAQTAAGAPLAAGAGAALPDAAADSAGVDAAVDGAAADGCAADGAPVGVPPPLQAANSSARTARTGTQRGILIRTPPCQARRRVSGWRDASVSAALGGAHTTTSVAKKSSAYIRLQSNDRRVGARPGRRCMMVPRDHDWREPWLTCASA